MFESQRIQELSLFYRKNAVFIGKQEKESINVCGIKIWQFKKKSC